MPGHSGHKAGKAVEVAVRLRLGREWVLVKALIDSGADASTISSRLLDAIPLPQREETRTQLKGEFGGQTTALTKARLVGKLTDHWGLTRMWPLNAFVVEKQDYDLILGLPWLEKEDPIIRFKDKIISWPPSKEGMALIASRRDLKKALQEARGAAVTLPEEPNENSLVIRRVMTGKQTTGQEAKEDLEPKEGEVPQEYLSLLQDIQERRGVGPVKATTTHRIELLDGETPPYGPIYPLAAVEQEVLKDYLAKALRLGWIRSSLSPAGAPILFVPKKNGKLRLCVDYRALNRITKKNRAALPLLSELLDRLAQMRWFTRLDIQDAYYEIAIEKGDEWKTAFRTKYGHYEYLVMPMGLTNAPATFQTYINNCLASLVDDFCVVYLDDILIYSRTLEEHREHVRRVLERLQEYGLPVSVEKSVFHAKSVRFLGFVISESGVAMEPERVEVIQNWPTPTSVRDIRVFLGFTGFYRRFIHRYSYVARPLTDRLRGEDTGAIQLSLPEKASFLTLKLLFTSAPLLRHYDPSLRLRVDTDASGYAIGAVLSQLFDDGWHPTAYFSRKLAGPELRYGTPDAELMAIVEAFRAWRHYLTYSQHVIVVRTDHLNHRYFATKPQLSARQGRWLDDLAGYDFEIQYNPGHRNPADGLSRMPGLRDVEETAAAVTAPLADFMKRFTDQSGETGGAESGDTGRGARGLPPSTQTQGSRALTVVPGEVGCRPLPQLCVRRVTTGPDRGQPETLLPSLVTAVKEAQLADSFVTEEKWKRRQSRKGRLHTTWEMGEDGLLRYRDRIYVPDHSPLAAEILRLHHDSRWGGHWGMAKTIKRISRDFYWHSQRKQIKDHVRTCLECQLSKSRHHQPYGQLAPLPIPSEPFQEISFDFITSLPSSRTRHGKEVNTILVVVCRLTKFALYIPTTDKLTSNGLADTLLHCVFLRYGFPDGIVTDRDKLVTSRFWGALTHALAIRRRLSTAFHAQTDGQTERIHQLLEHYLRLFCNYEQDDWATWLPFAEYAYNTTPHDALGISPAQALRGYQPRGPQDPFTREPPCRNRKAEDRAKELRRDRERLVALLEQAQAQYKKWYDSKRTPKTFAPEEWVLLSTKNLRLKRPCRKFAEKYVGPFQVLGAKGHHGLAYTLNLPPRWRVHPTFPVTVLEPYVPREGEPIQPPRDIPVENDDVFEVETILDHKGPRNNRQYLVRWKGYSEEDDDWVKKRDFVSMELITEYEAKLQEIQTSSQ